MSPNTYLDERRIYCLSFDVGLELFHISEHILNNQIVQIDDTEGGHVDEVVFEILQVESFDIERSEQIVVLVIVHLQLQNL